MSTANRRRYRGLMARAQDQRGTPEGESCARLAAAMLAQHPELKGAELPEERREYTWESDVGKTVLQWVIEAQGIEAKARTDRDERVFLVDANEPTHDLIERRYEAIRGKCEELVQGVLITYLHGAVPHPQFDEAIQATGDRERAPETVRDRTARAIASAAYGLGVLDNRAAALGEGE